MSGAWLACMGALLLFGLKGWPPLAAALADKAGLSLSGYCYLLLAGEAWLAGIALAITFAI